MAVEQYLIDTSALMRMGNPVVGSVWRSKVGFGVVRICEATEIEYLYSSQSRSEYEQQQDELDEFYPRQSMPDRVWERACEVQYELAKRSCLRSAGPIDLLVAATAELAGLTVLHYDADFDTVAKVTGQPTRWILPAGTV